MNHNNQQPGSADREQFDADMRKIFGGCRTYEDLNSCWAGAYGYLWRIAASRRTGNFVPCEDCRDIPGDGSLCKSVCRLAAPVSAGQAVQVASIDHDAFWVLVAKCRDAKPGEDYCKASAALVAYVDNFTASRCAAPVSPPDGAMPEPVLWAVYFKRKGSTTEDVLIVDDKNDAEKQVDVPLITRVVPLYAAHAQTTKTAEQTFNERFQEDSHVGWKPLDYWSAGFEAAQRNAAQPAEGITLPEALSAISRFAKADHPYSSATIAERQEARAQFDAIAARIGAIEPVEGSAQVASEQIGVVVEWPNGKRDLLQIIDPKPEFVDHWQKSGATVRALLVGAAPERSDTPALAHGHRDDYFLLANARRIGQMQIHKVVRMQNWELAAELFATGSNSAHQICVDAGVDPESIKVRRIDGDKQGAQGDAS